MRLVISDTIAPIMTSLQCRYINKDAMYAQWDLLITQSVMTHGVTYVYNIQWQVWDTDQNMNPETTLHTLPSRASYGSVFCDYVRENYLVTLKRFPLYVITHICTDYSRLPFLHLIYIYIFIFTWIPTECHHLLIAELLFRMASCVDASINFLSYKNTAVQ